MTPDKAFRIADNCLAVVPVLELVDDSVRQGFGVQFSGPGHGDHFHGPWFNDYMRAYSFRNALVAQLSEEIQNWEVVDGKQELKPRPTRRWFDGGLRTTP